MKKVKFLRR